MRTPGGREAQGAYLRRPDIREGPATSGSSGSQPNQGESQSVHRFVDAATPSGQEVCPRASGDAPLATADPSSPRAAGIDALPAASLADALASQADPSAAPPLCGETIDAALHPSGADPQRPGPTASGDAGLVGVLPPGEPAGNRSLAGCRPAQRSARSSMPGARRPAPPTRWWPHTQRSGPDPHRRRRRGPRPAGGPVRRTGPLLSSGFLAELMANTTASTAGSATKERGCGPQGRGCGQEGSDAG